jgi:endo-1,4-beta-xylanase
VKLYYNDYNVEYSGAKSTAALNLVKKLKARGIKIDGVGLQAHFIVGSTPGLSAQTANLETFTAEGVEVAYTELDVRFTSLPPTDAGLTQQKTDYYNTVAACVAAGCVGVTIWDYTDKYSWIPSTFSGQGDALPWDDQLVKKAGAYGGIVSALGGTFTVSSTASASATTLATSTILATSTTVSTTSAAATTSAAVGSVPHYGQCGGNNWTGGTVCVSPYTCKYSNDWYSQCL